MDKYHLSLILLLAISSNLDNIAVGVAYGARRIGVPLSSNLAIAVITGTGTALSMVAGQFISAWLHPDTANNVGASIIIGAGAWIVANELFKLVKKGAPRAHVSKGTANSDGLPGKILENPSVADMDLSGHISMKEAVLLGMALTLNNVGGGIGAGLAGLNPVLTTFFVMLFSLATMRIGIQMGYGHAARWLGAWAGPTSGLLLVILGIRALMG